MTNDEKTIHDAIISIKARKEVLMIRPTHTLSVELGMALKDFSRERICNAISSLKESGKITVGNTLNDIYYKINENHNEDEIMEHFQIAIKTFLEKKASSDPHFAERLKIESKSMEECCNYILGEVKKKATGQWAACTDEEVYGMAIHYWDEDNIKVDKPAACKVVTNKKLTPEEKKEAETLKKQKQERNAQKVQKAEEQLETAKKRNQEKKFQRERTKQKEDGTLFLFSDEDFV